MTKLYINEEAAASLRNARARNDKAMKKTLWAGIRFAFGDSIPKGVKLGVDIDDNGTDVYRALYVKGSSPRQYLTAPVVRDASNFITLTPGVGEGLQWASISRACLLRILRESDDGSVVFEESEDLPANFPAPASDDALVLDSATGTLYFKA